MQRASVHEVAPNSAATEKVSRRRQPNFGRGASRIWFTPAGKVAAVRLNGLMGLFVTLWNDEVCESGNAIKQCNFQNNYGVIP